MLIAVEDFVALASYIANYEIYVLLVRNSYIKNGPYFIRQNFITYFSLLCKVYCVFLTNIEV
jgi:hypothetical protein